MLSMLLADQSFTLFATGEKIIPGIGDLLLQTAGESQEMSMTTGIDMMLDVLAMAKTPGTVVSPASTAQSQIS